MTGWDVLTIVMAVFLIWFYGGLLYRAIMKRTSPKYALKYEQNQERKRQRIRQRYIDKRQQREAKRRARLTKWAEANADDPLAKAYLATSSSVSSSSSTQSVDEFDAVAELRRAQNESDKFERERADRKMAMELHAQQLLDWAVANPHIPEARRHLSEQLEEATTRLRYAETDVNYQRFMATHQQDEAGAESILYASNLAEAEAKKRTEEELIRRLQKALSVPLPTSEEQ